MSFLTLRRRAEATTWEGETYNGLDFRSAKAFGAKFTRCTFTDCKFDLSDFRTARFDGCTFTECSMSKVDFSTSFVERTAFVRCDLEQSSFMGAWMNDVEFEDCRMAYAETLFQNATLKSNVGFVRCNLHGSNVDFREAEPGVVRFEGCNLWSAKASFGCAFWNSEFDEQTCQRFIALVARVYPTNDGRVKLMEYAGREYPVVERAMRETK